MPTAAILAGGRSSRFGSDKAMYLINGAPMLSIVYDALSDKFDEIIVVGGDSELYRSLGYRCQPDLVPGKDILSGLHSALKHTTSDWIFLCACDMPLIDVRVVEVLVDNLSDDDVILPILDETRQPLHAIYKRAILPVVEELCLNENAWLPGLFAKVKVRYIEECLFSDIPYYRRSFVNLNDRAVLRQYLPLLTGR